MPRAYGRDRVESLDGGRLRITSPAPKGWRAQRPATRTTAEFPGTAVAWDDAIYEVVSSEERSGANSRYLLAPWKEHHAIRLTVDYNATSEAALATEQRRSASRNRMSAGIFAVGLFAGLLPAHIQKQIESEFGFIATRMTLLSLLPELALAGIAAFGLPIEALPGPKWPGWFIALGAFALVEVLARSWYSLLHNRPIGSIAGLLFWHLAIALSPRARRFDRDGTRKQESGLSSTSPLAPGDFERERDMYAVREPFLALLPPGDQAQLASTFGFDPIDGGRRSALLIAIVAGVGVASSLLRIVDGAGRVSTWASLAVGGLLLVEQLLRFREFYRGNAAGSVLGAIARPFCVVLLTMKPRALKEGSTSQAVRPLPAVWEGDAPEEHAPDDQIGR
jgi:hypothetical protein